MFVASFIHKFLANSIFIQIERKPLNLSSTSMRSSRKKIFIILTKGNYQNVSDWSKKTLLKNSFKFAILVFVFFSIEVEKKLYCHSSLQQLIRVGNIKIL